MAQSLKDPTGTKLALIMAAGELFGDNGLDGTSIRDIARKAEANVAAVNYHFGSKEHLYTETLLYFARLTFDRLDGFAPNPEELKSPAGMRREVERLVRQRYDAYLCAKKPDWVSRLFINCMMHPSDSLREVVEKVFEPDSNHLLDVIGKMCPEMPQEKRRQWMLHLVGQPIFYVHARWPVLMSMGQSEYSKEFIETAIEFTTDALFSSIEKARAGAGKKG